MGGGPTADVLVVGAGPGGSTAALNLARAGVDVALLERSAFPRDKACGDGVGAQGLSVLTRCGLGAWASQFPAPTTLRLAAPSGEWLDILPDDAGGACYGRTIPRRALDARLAEAAEAAGARLVEGAGVSGAEINGDGSGRPVRVSLDGGTVRADLLILADGSPAPVTRALGLVRAPAELVACRQYYVGDSGPMERLEIHFRADIAPGYCWVFPEGQGRANVGSGTFVRRARRGGISLRRVLTDFVRQGPDGRLAKAIPQGPLRGHLLRTRLQDTQTHAARVLVAGDAAGLVSPLTGEGISAALESGELAAAYALKALKAGDLSLTGLAGYSRTLSERYAMDQAAARWVRLALYAPGFVSRLFRRLASEPALALLVGLVIIGQESPRRLLRPSLMMRLLRSV